MEKISIQDRVKGIIKNIKYKNTNIKKLDLTGAEQIIIYKSLIQFRKNIYRVFKEEIKWHSKQELEYVNELLNKNFFNRLTVRECRTVCEALYDTLKSEGFFEESQADFFMEIEKESKLDLIAINEVFEKMQQYAEYSFLKQIKKCSRKRKDDYGEDAMVTLINGYKN